jgi:hypothetical protein
MRCTIGVSSSSALEIDQESSDWRKLGANAGSA